MRHGLSRTKFHTSSTRQSDLQDPAGRKPPALGIVSAESSEFLDGDESFDLESGTELEAKMASAILPHARFFGVEDLPVAEIVEDSREVGPGQWAVYRVGLDDPDQVIADTMARGAAAILTEQLLPCPIPQCIVADVEMASASIEHVRLGRPDTRVLTIAVTGNAGKTTTALLIAKLLRDQGLRAAYQCDLGSCDGVLQSTDTDAANGGRALIQFLDNAADTGSQIAVLEINDAVAAAGGYQCVEFDLMVVCGQARDAQSFGVDTPTSLSDRLAADGVLILPHTIGVDPDDQSEAFDLSHASVVTYGFHGADVEVDIIDNSGGLMTMLLCHDDTMHVMESRLTGRQNAENIAAAATVGRLLDRPLHEIGESLGGLKSVPGRDERFANFGLPTAVLESAGDPLRAKRAVDNYRNQHGVGKIWTVLAIDNATESDLPSYGALLERTSDHVTLTSTGVTTIEFSFFGARSPRRRQRLWRLPIGRRSQAERSSGR